MNISFSTLACPEWSLRQALDLASRCGYHGLELRFLENETELWKRPEFSSSQLASTRSMIRDHGLVISCVDTSCKFDSPDEAVRKAAEENAVRFAELAQKLNAGGIRVFGDQVKPGQDLASTKKWVSEALWWLAEKTRPMNVEVWMETHGDFTRATDVKQVLMDCGCHGVGVVWDPANGVEDHGEDPEAAGKSLGAYIRHVHFKDLLRRPGSDKWEYVLMGEGNLGVRTVLAALRRQNYSGFISYEWEKKWHPEIPSAEIAIPQFADWIRKA